MLVSLHVKNLALIDETEVYFGNGLNIMTGETGAGKSVIIGSISLALGAKADKELIRTGAEYAMIELVFQISKEKQIAAIRKMDLPIEADGQVIIVRRIMTGRSVCKVNGEAVTAKQVKELAELLIDIHGQHEHQSLLHKKKHFEILDEFAGDNLISIKSQIKEHYDCYKHIQKELEEYGMDEESRKKEFSFAEFEAGEIRDAALFVGEDEILEQNYRKMMYARKIGEVVSKVHGCIGYEREDSAGTQTGRALKELKSVIEYDKNLSEYGEQLTQIDSLLNDFNREISDYLSDLEFDDVDFQQTEDRLNLINRLKDKYGKSLEAILLYGKAQEEKCSKLADYEAYLEKLKNKLQNEKEELSTWCEKASQYRIKKAEILSAHMEEALRDLNFLNVQFKIEVRKEDGHFTKEGYNDIEFLISTNPGEPVKSLGNVASGGELSRIMLALKTVLADKDDIETLIFDEIDAGISGKTAWKVSEKMGVLSRNHQVICITHLPQIAAMSDRHFVIEKIFDGASTKTDIRILDRNEENQEVARLLGGADLTENALKAAEELKAQAMQTKNDKNY